MTSLIAPTATVFEVVTTALTRPDGAGTARILGIRQRPEYLAGHLPGAVQSNSAPSQTGSTIYPTHDLAPPRDRAAHPRADGGHDRLHADLTDRQIAMATSFTEPALSSASRAGLVNNLNFGISWGLLLLLFASADLSVGRCLLSIPWSAAPDSWSPAPCRSS